jgi:hypothetical protein
VNAKRPPRVRPPVPVNEWNPGDTGVLDRPVELAREVDWRRGVMDQLKPMAETLGEVRDLARETDAALEHKASKELVKDLGTRVDLLTNNVRWLRYLTLGVLVVGILEKLAEKRGML